MSFGKLVYLVYEKYKWYTLAITLSLLVTAICMGNTRFGMIAGVLAVYIGICALMSVNTLTFYKGKLRDK